MIFITSCVTRFGTITSDGRNGGNLCRMVYIFFFLFLEIVYIFPPRFEYFAERPSSLTRPRFTSSGYREKIKRRGESAHCLSRPSGKSAIFTRTRFIERHLRKMVSRESMKRLGVKFRRALSYLIVVIVVQRTFPRVN